MILQSLRIEGFKSFDRGRVLTFRSNDRFCLLTGRNLVDEDLGANGTGKSSTFDALCWLLYGKTPRNLKATAVKNWESSRQCSVAGRFENEHGVFEIVRTWSPNSLMITGQEGKLQETTQEELEKVVGLDFTGFLNTILVSQFVPLFFDLSPTEQLALFSTSFDLDHWLDRSDRAKTKTTSIEKELADSQTRSEVLSLRIQNLTSKIDTIGMDLQEWNTKQEAEKEELEKQRREKILDLRTSEEHQTHIDSELRVLQKDIEELESAILLLSNLTSEKETLRFQIGAEIRSLEGERKVALDTHDSLLSMEGRVCNTCFQPINKKHAKEQASLFWATSEALGSKISEVQEKNRLVKEEKDSLEEDLRLKELGLKEKKNQYDTNVSQNSGLLLRVTRLKSEVKSLEESLKKLASASNPHQKYLDGAKAELNQAKVDLRQLNRGVMKLGKRMEDVRFWVKGFKDVRLFIIEELLDQFEIEVNNALAQLGLPDWSVQFAIDKETKSKTIKRGFTVLVSSPNSGDSVPWEAWSGGESQRLRLAGTMGLSNLILTSRGVDFPLEVWDEPSTWLSEEGIESLLYLLHQRAIESNRQTWIIDHRALDFAFDRVVCVEKTDRGSRFIES